MDTFGILIILTGILVFITSFVVFFKRRSLCQNSKDCSEEDATEPIIFKTYTNLSFINKLKNERRNDVIILSICMMVLTFFVVSCLFLIYYFTGENVLVIFETAPTTSATHTLEVLPAPVKFEEPLITKPIANYSQQIQTPSQKFTWSKMRESCKMQSCRARGEISKCR